MAENPIAIYNEGYYYYSGTNGYPLNYNKAMQCFQKAAELGVSQAMNYMGLIYEQGQLVKRNYSIALDWFFKAVQAKPVDPNALYNIGRMYYNGLGVEKNIGKAKELFEQAFVLCQDKKAPYAGCCYMLGVIQNECFKNYIEAYKLFSDAATYGNIAEAWYNKGWLMENYIVPGAVSRAPEGLRNRLRSTMVAECYENAAKLGCIPAMDAFGRLLIKLNNAQATDDARYWIEKAAEAGFEPAKNRIKMLNFARGDSLWSLLKK